MARQINLQEKLYLFFNLSLDNDFRRLPLRFRLKVLKEFFGQKINKIGNRFVLNCFIPPYPSLAFRRFINALINHKDSITYLDMAVTDKCNYNCSFCSNKYNFKRKEMPLETIKKIIIELQKKRLSQIAFTGGEPFLREDLPEIIRFLGDKTISYVYTSGQGFNEKKAKELKKAGLFGIAVSLDSHKENIHNSLRGNKKAFKQALKSVGLSKKFGFYTIIQTIVRKENLSELEEFLKFSKKLGADEIRVLELFPAGNLLGKKEVIFNEKERNELIKMHKLSRNRKDLPKVTSMAYIDSKFFWNCAAGYTFFYIGSDGRLFPCDMVPLSFGNLQKEDFETVWKRIRKIFSKPHENCIAVEYAEKIAKYRNKKISFRKSFEICKNHCPKANSDYFNFLPKSNQ